MSYPFRFAYAGCRRSRQRLGLAGRDAFALFYSLNRTRQPPSAGAENVFQRDIFRPAKTAMFNQAQTPRREVESFGTTVNQTA